MMVYRPRVADQVLRRRLETSGAVLIDGPKACGKTATALQVAKSVVHMDRDPGARELVHLDPSLLFDQTTPILFDEWQEEPDLWNHVRHAVDDRGPRRGLYLLTGSATPRDDIRRHSGAGRISRVRMRPMSLFESGDSTGEVSLARLFEGDALRAGNPDLTLVDISDRIVAGGWPGFLDLDPADAADEVRNYLDQAVEVDVPETLGERRDPEGLKRLLASLGRHTGTSTAFTEIAKDVAGASAIDSRSTTIRYTRALDRLMLLDDVPAWRPHMRSKTPLRATAVRFLVDPSLGIAAMGVSAAQLLKDPKALGFQFEALVARDLRVYSSPLRGRLHHWRDNNGHEVDFIVTLDDGRWGAFEVKLNPRRIDEAAASLRRFAEKVDTTRTGDPAFLGVIVVNGFSYLRSDGVAVVNIAALGP